MDGKMLSRLGGLLFVLVAGIGWRIYVRGEDSDEVRAEAMKVLALVEGYEQNKEILLKMADQAHSVAFSAAYEMGGRRTRATFDEDKYIEAFFKSMVSQADLRGRQDLKKSLLALKAIGDAGNEEPSAAEPPQDPAPATEINNVEAAEPPVAELVEAEFSKDKIASLSDDELDDEIHQYVSKPLADADPNDWPRELKKLSKGQRMVILTNMLEAEVNNGGFEQYFSNSWGHTAKEAILACKLIKAKKHTNLLRRAIAVYVRANPEQRQLKVDKAVKGYLKKYKDTDMQKIDDEFFRTKESLQKLRLAYIRANPNVFSGG